MVDKFEILTYYDKKGECGVSMEWGLEKSYSREEK